GVFSQFLQLFLAGVAQGCVYALVALGVVLIYKATETVNFSQGDLMMLGAFFGLTACTILGWPYWATTVFAIVAMAAARPLLSRASEASSSSRWPSWFPTSASARSNRSLSRWSSVSAACRARWSGV